MSKAELVVRAQNAIMAILAELEIATGDEVESISIVTTDNTLIADPVRTTLRAVAIYLPQRTEKRWNL